MRQLFYLIFFLHIFFFGTQPVFAENINVYDSIKGTSCLYLEQNTPLVISVADQDTSIVSSIRFRTLQIGRINYSVSMSYVRSFTSERSEKQASYEVNPNDLSVMPLNEVSPDVLMRSDASVNIMQHESEASLSYAFGVQDRSEPLSLATKFRSGEDGFNVSLVGTWFIGDYLSAGTIQVEVRAGGTSIENAESLATGSVNFQIGNDEENGRMYSIPLDRNATIYSNEDFYVIITYPEAMTRPQGCAMNSLIETTPERYWAKLNGEWVDIQKVDGYATCAWLMNATETDAKTNTWLTITSGASGTLLAGRMAQVNLLLEGEKASLGTQMANLLLTVNDACRSEITIPVIFNINEAPYFIDPPAEVFVNENEQIKIVVEVGDSENDECFITPLEGAKIVSYTFQDSKLTLIIEPHTGDMGTYQVRFRVTDSKGGSDEFELNIYVTSSNDQLDYLYDDEWFVYSYINEGIDYNINNLFRFKNGDDILFQVSSQDEDIFSVIQKNDSIFSIIPHAIGDSYLYFIINNPQGKNKSVCLVPVTVGLCKVATFIIKQKWNRVLFVDNLNGEFSAEGYQWYKNDKLIENATKQYYSAGDNAEDFLDVNATYYVRLVTTTGDTIYTCPISPVYQQESVVRIYPTPAEKGDVLRISTDFQNTDTDMIQLRMYDFSGRLIKTDTFSGQYGEFHLPSVSRGFYIIKLSNGEDEYVQNIYIK